MGKVLSTFDIGWPGAISRSVDDIVVSLKNAGTDPIPFGAPVFLTSDGEGGITYADGASDRYVYAFRIQEIAANDDVYIPIGEVSVTCGTEFVQKVEKVASPAAKDYEVEAGVILPGAFYYRLAD